jgi:hypothetical protein
VSNQFLNHFVCVRGYWQKCKKFHLHVFSCRLSRFPLSLSPPAPDPFVRSASSSNRTKPNQPSPAQSAHSRTEAAAAALDCKGDIETFLVPGERAIAVWLKYLFMASLLRDKGFLLRFFRDEISSDLSFLRSELDK